MSTTLTGTITDKQDESPIETATVRLFGGATSLGDVRAAAVHRGGVVAWTRILTGFGGSPWNAWQKYVMNFVAGITWVEFREQAVEHNPHLADDGGDFVATKSYKIPEQAGDQPEYHWTRPLTGFAGSRWDCWLKCVQGKVSGITRQTFMVEVEERNPVLVQDEHGFFANKSYLLPENDPGSTELSWTRPLLGYRGSHRAAWHEHIEGQVRGISKDQFLADVVLYNPAVAQDHYVLLANKAYVLPQNPLRPSYYLYDTTDTEGRFTFELLTTPGSYELIVQAPGYHPRAQQFLLSENAVRDIALLPTTPTIHSDWAGYPSAPPKVRRLIDRALALLGDDTQVYDSLTDDLKELATGKPANWSAGTKHHKDIVCADLITMALHAAGVAHGWSVTEPQGTAFKTGHTANFYRPSSSNNLLRQVDENEEWLPGDILVYWDGSFGTERMRHVNLYVGPFSGVDLSGNEHPASARYDVVNASLDDDQTGIELGVAILPMTSAGCRTHKCGRQSMLRVRHRQLWN